MQVTAVFFQTPNGAPEKLDALKASCRQERLQVVDCGPATDPHTVRSQLPKTPSIIFLPALEEDCLGVKLAQEALLDSPPLVFNGPPRVILLYGDELPSKDFLCLAFREGADDVMRLKEGSLEIHVKRAARLLQLRLENSFSGGEIHEKNSVLERHCERLERACARWQERLQALASAAERMATGELRVAERAPRVLIVASSRPQALGAENIASRLGFIPSIARTGAEALESLDQNKPDVILTDGTLPDMDASALAVQARRALGNHPVIIIVWSSNLNQESSLLRPDSGIDDFVLKSATSQAVSLLAAAFLGALR